MSTPAGSFPDLAALDAATQAGNTQPPEAGSATQPAQITFAKDNLQPGDQHGFYVGIADVIQLTVWNSNAALASIAAQVRIILPDGTVQTLTLGIAALTSDRTANTAKVTNVEGFIVSAVLGPPAVATSRGQTFAALDVVRGAAPTIATVMHLFADYVTTGMHPTWPFGRVVSAVEGPGFIYSIVQANPPVGGVPAGFNVPAGARWRPISLTIALQTSASAGARTVSVNISNTLTQSFLMGAPATQAPSLVINYAAAPGVTPQVSPNNTGMTTSLPGDPRLRVGDSVGFAGIIQVTDQFSSHTLNVEEWLDV